MKTHRFGRWRRSGITVTLVFVVAGSVATSLMVLGSPVQAADYPSWEDVQNAKANTGDAAAKSTEIQGLIADLKVQVSATEALAEQRGAELQVAEDQLFEATQRANEIMNKAAVSQAEADMASVQAGRLTAQLYRSRSSDLSVNLLLDGENSGELLSKLGSMSKLAERSNDIYMNAATAQNAAKSLGEQAKIAQTERETLRVGARATLTEAIVATEAVTATLAESQSKTVELEAQLAALQATESATVDEYRKGVEARARAAAEAGAPGRGGGPGLPGGYIGDRGWAIPALGRITDHFGQREIICGPGGCSGGFHRGTDIGTGCGAPIYAASSGTVVYAGPNGTYGNFVLIDHGDGLETGYAHIRPGGIFVRPGQWVSVGENIASSGTTGASDGCHLHYEVRPDGVAVNPVPFMSERGAPLG